MGKNPDKHMSMTSGRREKALSPSGRFNQRMQISGLSDTRKDLLIIFLFASLHEAAN
jgi:hypothetical protein